MFVAGGRVEVGGLISDLMMCACLQLWTMRGLVLICGGLGINPVIVTGGLTSGWKQSCGSSFIGTDSESRSHARGCFK